MARTRSCHPQHRIPAFANTANDAALQGNSNCFWPDSASEVAAAERFRWNSIVHENRAKQSLAPHHSEHLVTERLHKLVCQASFQSSLSLLALAGGMADIPQKKCKSEQPEGWYQQAPTHFHHYAESRAKLEAPLIFEKQFVDLDTKERGEKGKRSATRRTTSLAPLFGGPCSRKLHTIC